MIKVSSPSHGLYNGSSILFFVESMHSEAEPQACRHVAVWTCYLKFRAIWCSPAPVPEKKLDLGQLEASKNVSQAATARASNGQQTQQQVITPPCLLVDKLYGVVEMHQNVSLHTVPCLLSVTIAASS